MSFAGWIILFNYGTIFVLEFFKYSELSIIIAIIILLIITAPLNIYRNTCFAVFYNDLVSDEYCGSKAIPEREQDNLNLRSDYPFIIINFLNYIQNHYSISEIHKNELSILLIDYTK